ncbi:MAG: transglycosylase SLT domain-containing protein, partial [Myxococcales bacterium]|nr:transglycosylase SLT domain-containing protein [Myxococcales bacterium]
VYERAAKECKRAGADHKDTLVKSRYQAGRGRYAEGKYARAAREFEALATDARDHSYADDALVLAGESWASAGQRDKERRAYERALSDHPDGDMTGEARRRLLVMAFADKRLEDALALADEGLARERDRKLIAKMHYFRGRALAGLTRADEAEAAWIAAIEAAPLDYPAFQALSRLREVGEEAFARGVAVLERAGDEAVPSLELPASEEATRAALLARLGLGAEAAEELSAAGIDGWPAAAVLAQAGLWEASQRAVGRVGASWRERPPAGTARAMWELAHPLAFSRLVREGESSRGVPAFLTFAIMQTESRFNPGATSWAGARGLLQMMPSTAKGVAKRAGVEDHSPARLYNPEYNLGLGIFHLGELVARFGGEDAAVPLAIPGYNAGAGAVDKWLTERGDWDLDLFIESIPYDETRKYTQSVLGRWYAYRWIHGPKDQDARRKIPYLPTAIPKKE